jgi:uncharacterized protein with HEPN domain
MKKDDTVYLRHILDAIQRIQEYLADASYDQFLQNYLLQDGVVRQLEIIGEAARNVSSAFQSTHPEFAWSKIIGIRNRLIHAYFEVNLSIVWNTVQVDLPPLKQQVERILEEMGVATKQDERSCYH